MRPSPAAFHKYFGGQNLDTRATFQVAAPFNFQVILCMRHFSEFARQKPVPSQMYNGTVYKCENCARWAILDDTFTDIGIIPFPSSKTLRQIQLEKNAKVKARNHQKACMPDVAAAEKHKQMLSSMLPILIPYS